MTNRRVLLNGVASLACAVIGTDLLLRGDFGSASFCFAMAILNLVLVIVWVVKP